jgi:hypothetical protein
VSSTSASSDLKHQQHLLQQAAHQAADAASGFSQAVAAAAAPDAAGSSVKAAGSSSEPAGMVQQHGSHDAVDLPLPSSDSSAHAAEQSNSASAFAAWQESPLSGRLPPPSLGGGPHPDAAGIASAAATQDPLRTAAHAHMISAGSDLDMERSTSLVWVSAPSADLGEAQSSGCRTAHSSGHSGRSATGAADAAPDPAGCLRTGSGIEVAADYADANAIPRESAGGSGSAGGSCRPPGGSWLTIQTMLPQSWAVW